MIIDLTPPKTGSVFWTCVISFLIIFKGQEILVKRIIKSFGSIYIFSYYYKIFLLKQMCEIFQSFLPKH